MSKSFIEENDKQASNANVQELYLMEKLYQAILDDKKRGKPSSSSDRELYLMEKLYQAMISDKKRNHKSK